MLGQTWRGICKLSIRGLKHLAQICRGVARAEVRWLPRA